MKLNDHFADLSAYGAKFIVIMLTNLTRSDKSNAGERKFKNHF